MDAQSQDLTTEAKTNTPLVSVIVPVYNVLPFIHEALDSAVNQTYSNLEIIVIDDGSTDGSSKVCDAYANRDPRICVIHQQNRGLSAARNVGLDVAKGDIIGFLDPDDAYDRTFVEELLCAMEQANSDVAVCHYTIHHTTHPMSRKAGDRSVPAIEAGRYDRKEILRALADGKLNVSVWNKLYRRRLWQDLRFREGHVYEDNETSLHAFDICESVCAIPQPLLLHRKRKDGITSVNSPENMRDMVLAATYFVSFVADRTPEVFTQTQFDSRQRSLFGCMVTAFASLSPGRDAKARALRLVLQKQILVCGEDLGVDNFGPRMVIAYHMAVACPWLLRIAFPLSHSLRLMLRSITNNPA